MIIVLLSACTNPISNQLFLEDQEFIDAMPSGKRHRVSWSRPGQKDDAQAEEEDTLTVPEGAPDLLEQTLVSINDINALLDDFLGFVDTVRSQPPTVRTEDGRTWGPYPWDAADGYELRVVCTRSGTGQFTWSFEQKTTDGDNWRPFFAGEHLAGATVSEGVGDFYVDFDLLSVADPQLSGYLRVDYDHRDDPIVGFEIYGQAADPDPISTYWYEVGDEAGRFSFHTTEHLAEEVEGAEYVIETRWIPGVGGRADARIYGGNVEDLVGDDEVEWTQCWGSAGMLVYQGDDHGLAEQVGSEADCPVDP